MIAASNITALAAVYSLQTLLHGTPDVAAVGQRGRRNRINAAAQWRTDQQGVNYEQQWPHVKKKILTKYSVLVSTKVHFLFSLCAVRETTTMLSMFTSAVRRVPAV